MKIQNLRHVCPAIVILALLFGTYSCGSDSMAGKLFTQMGDLFKIKRAIDASLVQGQSSIHIQNGRVITLGLVNTEHNDAEAPEREKAADEIVDILLDQIKDKKEFEGVEKVLVNFIHHEKKYWIVDLTMTIDYYEYKL